MVYFMVELTCSMIELVNAILKRLVTLPEVAVNLCPIWGWSIGVKHTVGWCFNSLTTNGAHMRQLF
jgi:hypothetical protein